MATPLRLREATDIILEATSVEFVRKLDDGALEVGKLELHRTRSEYPRRGPARDLIAVRTDKMLSRVFPVCAGTPRARSDAGRPRHRAMQFGRAAEILFVTLAGNKVIAVKDEYAGLGGDVQ